MSRRLESEFPRLSEKKDITVLDILDRYRRGEPRLKERLLEEFSRDDLLSKYAENSQLGKEDINLDLKTLSEC